VEITIAPDGEIITRGPNVMVGYYKKPDATAEVLDAAGWFHTGDIGQMDADGYLKITDRKKDIIVTAGGKNIAPQPIENRAKTCPFVANAVMVGDRRPFPILIVVPKFETLAAWAKRQGLADADPAALVGLPEVRRMMDREIGTTLQDLAGFERPKKLLLLSRDFSLEGGELTPKMSVRRRVVEQRNADAIEALYREH
jgi:long-chain acyl-CoA synthetase